MKTTWEACLGAAAAGCGSRSSDGSDDEGTEGGSPSSSASQRKDSAASSGSCSSGAGRRPDTEQARLRRAFQENYVGVWRSLRRMGVVADRADDVAQQVFLIALRALARISEGSERAFLYGTAVRLAHGMRRRGEREVPSLGLDLAPSLIPSPEQLTDQKRAREALDAFILSLDADTRTVFVLTEFDGFTTPEIADLLGVPLGTAASRLRRAREKLRAMMGEIYGEKP